jgi:hypothetical protein
VAAVGGGRQGAGGEAGGEGKQSQGGAPEPGGGVGRNGAQRPAGLAPSFCGSRISWTRPPVFSSL